LVGRELQELDGTWLEGEEVTLESSGGNNDGGKPWDQFEANYKITGKMFVSGGAAAAVPPLEAMESIGDSISESFSGLFGSASGIGDSGVGGGAGSGRSATQERTKDLMGEMSAEENEEDEGEGKPGGDGSSFAVPSLPAAMSSFFFGGSGRRRRARLRRRRQQGHVEHSQQLVASFGVIEQEETGMIAEESATNEGAEVLLTEVRVGGSPYIACLHDFYSCP
jgi:hypothetical protein